MRMGIESDVMNFDGNTPILNDNANNLIVELRRKLGFEAKMGLYIIHYISASACVYGYWWLRFSYNLR